MFQVVPPSVEYCQLATSLPSVTFTVPFVVIPSVADVPVSALSATVGAAESALLLPPPESATPRAPRAAIPKSAPTKPEETSLPASVSTPPAFTKTWLDTPSSADT